MKHCKIPPELEQISISNSRAALATSKNYQQRERPHILTRMSTLILNFVRSLYNLETFGLSKYHWVLNSYPILYIIICFSLKFNLLLLIFAICSLFESLCKFPHITSRKMQLHLYFTHTILHFIHIYCMIVIEKLGGRSYA